MQSRGGGLTLLICNTVHTVWAVGALDYRTEKSMLSQ